MLNVKDNQIESIDNTLIALDRNLDLRNLDLRGNPLTFFPDYEKKMQSFMTRLEIFDKRLV